MKKLLLALFAFTLPLMSSATHVLGGQIYWDALGNDQYDVYADVYYDASGAFPPGSVNIEIDGVSHTALSDTLIQVANNCINSTYRIQRFKMTLNIPAPTSAPIHFVINDCCRANSVNVNNTGVFVIESRMYPAGANLSSPRFNSIARIGGGSTLYFNPTNPANLQTQVGLTEPLTEISGSIMPVAYNTGYSYQQPSSPNDFLTPGGLYYFGATTQGAYFISAEAHSVDAGGNTTSEVHIDWRFSKTATSTSNSPPQINMSTSSVLTTQDSVKYQTTASRGDSLLIQFMTSDFDFNPNFTPQQIAASLGGPAGNWTFTPVAPQSGYTSPSINSTEFEWVIPNNLPGGVYNFVYTARDNGCPIPFSTPITVEVTIPFDSVDVDTFGICQGQTIQLSAPITGSTYSWTPVADLNVANTQTVTASPSSDITYLCYVDGVLRGKYTVEVGASITPIGNKPAPNQIELTNPGDFDAHAFLYYFVPFAFNDTLVNISSSGMYHIAGVNGGCFSLSDSIQVLPDSSAGVFMIDQPVDPNDFLTLDDNSTYGANISIGGFDATLAIEEVLIPGAELSNKTGTVRLRLTDYNNDVHEAIGVPAGAEGVKFTYNTQIFLIGPSSKVELVVDSGAIEVPFAPVSLPHYYQAVQVTQIAGSIAGQSLTNELVPFVFNGQMAVSVEENELNQLVVYPQPAQDRVYVRGLETEVDFQLMDLNGRVLQSGILQDNDFLNVSEYSSGMYVLQLAREEEVHTVKVVVRR